MLELRGGAEVDQDAEPHASRPQVIDRLSPVLVDQSRVTAFTSTMILS